MKKPKISFSSLNLITAPHISIIPYGRYAGTTCINIQLAGCNLYCSWLNSDCEIELCENYQYAYFPYKKKSIDVEIDIIIEFIKNNLHVDKIFINGCEPFFHTTRLLELLKRIKTIKLNKYSTNAYYIKNTVLLETNCTYKHEDILQYVDVLMLSPKLLSCIPKKQTFDKAGLDYYDSFIRKHEFYLQNTPSILRTYLEYYKNIEKNWEMHFLISNTSDLSEIKNKYIQMHPILQENPQNIYIHYLNNDDKMYIEARKAVIENNWNFSFKK